MNGIDPTSAERIHWLYRVYDKRGLLLYVGRSKNVRNRWSEHAASRSRWLPYASRRVLTGPYDFADIDRLEREAIEREEPIFNGTGRRQSLRQRVQRSRYGGPAPRLTQEERDFMNAESRYLSRYKPRKAAA